MAPLPAAAAPRRPRFSLDLTLLFGAGAAAVSVLVVLPLAFVVAVAIDTGWPTVSALVFRPRVAELLLNTALLVLVTLPATLLLGLGVAWLTERSDVPGAPFWRWLAVAPLAIPAFLQSYAWVTLRPGLHGLWGAGLVSVLAYFPFLYLPLASTLRRLDPALEEAAGSLGLSPARVFVRVTLPQLRLAALGGSLLVGLHLLGEYGLYGMIRFDTFTTAIVDQFQSTFNGPAANMLAGVLVVCCLVFLLVDTALRRRVRFARIGGGAAAPVRPVALRHATLPCLLLLLALVGLSLGVPLVTLGRWLLIGGTAAWNWAEVGPALGGTVLLALAGGLMTTLAALPMAWLSVRAPGRVQRLVEAENYVVGSLPGVVVALALVTVTVHHARPIYQTAFTLLLAYVVLFLPRAMLSLRASIAQAPVNLEQAAASLGRPPVRALWATTVRLAAPGAATGFALVSLGIANELTATLMLAPNGTETLSTQFWARSAEIDYVGAAPFAILMVVFSAPLVWLLHAQSRRMAGR